MEDNAEISQSEREGERERNSEGATIREMLISFLEWKNLDGNRRNFNDIIIYLHNANNVQEFQVGQDIYVTL